MLLFTWNFKKYLQQLNWVFLGQCGLDTMSNWPNVRHNDAKWKKIPTREIFPSDFLVHRTWASTEYTVITHIGVYGEKQIKII